MTAVAQILGVVGAGTMGAGIAQAALEAGWQVRPHDPFAGAVERGRARIADGLRRRAAKRDLVGREVAIWVDDYLARLTVAPDLATLVTDTDLVIEAAEPLTRAIARPVRADRALSPPQIVLRIRSAIAAEAVLARDAGVASEADIDAALWLGAVHPEGPFAWLRRHAEMGA